MNQLAPPRFSVVIPTLDEEGELAETVRRAREALGPETEVIVVDGGSRDATIHVAQAAGRVVHHRPCRGDQLRKGAEEAKGTVFVFLHADTWLPPGAGAAIRHAVESGIDAGCLGFALRPPTRGLRYRLLERGVNWRTRRFSTATGDQAIFATRAAYQASGGFRAIPLFEDVAFVRSIRRTATFAPLDVAALTSSRRWERSGFLRTTITHWLLRAAFAAGADPARLDRIYGRLRRGTA